MVMNRLARMLPAALVLFGSCTLAFPAAVWGPSSNGLRMSASLVRNEFDNNELEVIIENTTAE
jgi:hypothetical protein